MRGDGAGNRLGGKTKMARPERLELPTYWFVAIAPRRISDLYGRPPLPIVVSFQAVSEVG